MDTSRHSYVSNPGIGLSCAEPDALSFLLDFNEGQPDGVDLHPSEIIIPPPTIRSTLSATTQGGLILASRLPGRPPDDVVEAEDHLTSDIFDMVADFLDTDPAVALTTLIKESGALRDPWRVEHSDSSTPGGRFTVVVQSKNGLPVSKPWGAFIMHVNNDCPEPGTWVRIQLFGHGSGKNFQTHKFIFRGPPGVINPIRKHLARVGPDLLPEPSVTATNSTPTVIIDKTTYWPDYPTYCASNYLFFSKYNYIGKRRLFVADAVVQAMQVLRPCLKVGKLAYRDAMDRGKVLDKMRKQTDLRKLRPHEAACVALCDKVQGDTRAVFLRGAIITVGKYTFDTDEPTQIQLFREEYCGRIPGTVLLVSGKNCLGCLPGIRDAEISIIECGFQGHPRCRTNFNVHDILQEYVGAKAAGTADDLVPRSNIGSITKVRDQQTFVGAGFNTNRKGMHYQNYDQMIELKSCLSFLYKPRDALTSKELNHLEELERITSLGRQRGDASSEKGLKDGFVPDGKRLSTLQNRFAITQIFRKLLTESPILMPQILAMPGVSRSNFDISPYQFIEDNILIAVIDYFKKLRLTVLPEGKLTGGIPIPLRVLIKGQFYLCFVTQQMNNSVTSRHNISFCVDALQEATQGGDVNNKLLALIGNPRQHHPYDEMLSKDYRDLITTEAFLTRKNGIINNLERITSGLYASAPFVGDAKPGDLFLANQRVAQIRTYWNQPYRILKAIPCGQQERVLLLRRDEQGPTIGDRITRLEFNLA